MPDEGTVQTCASCKYFYAVPDNSEVFVCRRSPPIPILSAQLAATDQYARAMWAVVRADWWCGEYKNAAAATETQVVVKEKAKKRKSKKKK